MILTPSKTEDIENTLVSLLYTHGPTEGPHLFEYLKIASIPCSKESFYRILRKLLTLEVIQKHAKLYELNRHYLQKLYTFSKQYIESPENSLEVFTLEDGDSITYSFKNPNLMGIYWAHSYNAIFDKHPSNIPILIYHPHEWLIHTRTESERFVLDRFNSEQKLVWFAIGANTLLDKKFKHEFNSDHIQINIGNSYDIPATKYINVLGDYIFTITTSQRFARKLDAFFCAYSNNMSLDKLMEITQEKNKTTLEIEKNSKKAKFFVKKFSQDFYRI